MSIGQLGSSGEQFRDFLGGGQQDIGRGLQAVLSSYANPEGNFVRLDNRSQGMFQLTNSEYQSVFDQDAQNSFAETWYSEYRVVLQLRAEALKKKLNRAYTKVLENSIYAPLRPNEDWAPGANRDFNDIDADSPTKMYADGSGSGTTGIEGAPVIPSGTLEEIPPEYAHPDWFSGTDPLSTGEPYDDIRRYMAEKLLDQDGGDAYFSDIDQDGQKIYFYDPNPNNTNDASYHVGNEDGSGNFLYYNLWNVGGDPLTSNGVNTAYSLGSLSWSAAGGYSNDRYSDIAQKMNVPPSVDTTQFVAAGNKPSGSTKNNTYFIEIPPMQDSRDVYQFLPAFAQGTNGVFDKGQRDIAEANGVPDTAFVPVVPPTSPATYVLAAGTTFYDPQGAVSQAMFSPSPTIPAPGNGIISPSTNIMNPKLVGPQTASTPPKPFQDLEGSPSNPVYHQGFIDSWLEARQVEKREAAVEAAYKAYVDGKALSDASPNPLTYEEIMDNVFSSLDTYDIDLGAIPGGAPTLPAGAEVSKNKLNGVLPYGYYSPSVPGGSPHTSVNPVFNVGGAYIGPGANSGNSLYQTIYDGLAAIADPSSMTPPGGQISGSVADNSGTNYSPAVPAPPTPPGSPYNSLGGSSELFSPIPIGAAQNTDGTGQADVDNAAGSNNLYSTLYQVPGFITGVDDVSKLFVGRQWDYVPGHVPNSGQNTTDGAGAVRYAAETMSVTVHAGLGWYDADKDNAGEMLLTMTPAIEGLVIQNIFDNIGVGMFDEQIQNGTWTGGYGAMGGPFFQVAGGRESVGFGIDIGTEDNYSFSEGPLQIGGGIGGIYWGHTSAVGKVYRIERLMEHSGGGTDPYSGDALGGLGTPPADAFDILKASLWAMGTLGGLDAYSSDPNDGMSPFPNIGIVGGHVDGNLPIPIPIPGGGLYWLNLPLTSYFSTSYDLVTDYMNQYLEAMKHEVLDSISAYSYATGGGYAMDSYGMRGEYHFTEKPALESLEKIPAIFGISLDGAIGAAIDFLGLDEDGRDYVLNGYDLTTGGVLGNVDSTEAYRHSFTAPEKRELDTGAFFTTASFLSQFQLNDLEYSYWTSTHQNEEMVSFDTLRILSLTGKDLLQSLSQAIFASAGGTDDSDSPAADAMVEVMNFMLSGFEEKLNEAVMWDLLMRDQSDKGGVLKKSVIPTIRSVSRRTSSLTSEGYDFLEDERKLFAYDYEEVRKPGILQQIQSWGQGSFELPNQLMAGTGNTRRYKPYLTGPDGRAGRQGYAANSGNTVNPGEFYDTTSRNDRVHAITRHTFDNDDTYYDDNWDIRVGFWQDTGLGDVNEVYVRKNTVSYGGINSGIGSGNATGPVVTTQIDRYVGSHNRIIGRGYDGAAPLDLQSFRTGYFSEKYFGHYISEVNFTGSGDHPTGDVAGDDAITYLLQGGIDGDMNRSGTITMHGGSKYYDRRNDYEFSMVAVDGTSIDLKANQALAPVLGGAMKLMSIESNNPNQVLGASTQNESNALTAVLYEHMRIRADGSNAQLVAEYRDAFNMGYLDDIFITASADAATGGGVTSSIRIKFDNQSWGGDVAQLGSYETARANEVVGTGTLSTVPGYLGDRSFFKNVNRAVTDIYLTSYFAFKRPPNTDAK